jgi:hypothetical protein
VDARADDEKYCDYRQEDWAAFRSRLDAAQRCVARYDNLLVTTFKAWVAARGCVVLGGCVIGGTVLCGGRVLRWDACRSVADFLFEATHQLVSLQRAGIIDIILSQDGDLTHLGAR